MLGFEYYSFFFMLIIEMLYISVRIGNASYRIEFGDI